MVYTASAPVKVLVKKSTSSIEPMAAVAPKASMSFCFSGLLLITVTHVLFATNSCVSGMLMCPKEPVYNNFHVSVFGMLQSCAAGEKQV